MLKNAPTLAIVAFHTAENEPLKIWEVIHFIGRFASLAATAPSASTPASSFARAAADRSSAAFALPRRCSSFCSLSRTCQ